MTGATTDRVFINEVVARDGLQIEPFFVPTPQKIELLDALSRMGFPKIEATAFVSPKAVPALRDAAAVMAGIRRAPGVRYVALVPNLRGAQDAIAAGVDELNVVISAGEGHNLANVRMTCEQSFDALAGVVRAARSAGVSLNGTVATAFGCPIDGVISATRTLGFIVRYIDMGLNSVTLADTTGMANPAQVERLVGAVLAAHPGLELTLHFHNTRGMGLANVIAAWRAGARRFDAALGGIGGCPFAPGATGNICTEDTVHMFEQIGVQTGVDLDGLIALSKALPALLGHDTPGQVVKAGPSFPPRSRPMETAAQARR